MLGSFPAGTRVTRNSDSLPGVIVEALNSTLIDDYGSIRGAYFVKLDHELSAGGCKLPGTTPMMHGGQFTVVR
jgi:hypothetical protein